jgi:2-oxoglutarate ferredoxin oxidoreductase subunit alpha
MTPVVLLSDVYLANGAEPWLIPAVSDLPRIDVPRPEATNGEVFLPYRRDERLVRPWAVPGTPGLEHRIGGLEKEGATGNVSYDPAHHEAMVRQRAEKVARIAEVIPPLEVHGPAEGDLLVVGWGGTFGAIFSAVERVRQKSGKKGAKIACAHLRYLHPLPANTAEVLGRFRRILVPELNTGQLLWLLRSLFDVDAQGYNKVQGKPFLISELEAKIESML